MLIVKKDKDDSGYTGIFGLPFGGSDKKNDFPFESQSMLDIVNNNINSSSGSFVNPTTPEKASSKSDLDNVDFWTGLSNLVTGNLDYQRALEQLQISNSYNQAMVDKQFNYENYLSSTAYQRAVEDLIKAGINPAMIYGNGGMGASSPSISAPNSSSGYSSRMSGSFMGTLVSTFANLTNSALSALKADQTKDLYQTLLNRNKRIYNSNIKQFKRNDSLDKFGGVKKLFDDLYSKIK